MSVCYAGNGRGLNNPEWQAIHNHGPLPAGKYTIVPAVLPRLGPIVFSLLPDPSNEMFGRSDFFIHWDNAYRNFSASEGCIVNNGGAVAGLPSPRFFDWLSGYVHGGHNSLSVLRLAELPAAPSSL